MRTAAIVVTHNRRDLLVECLYALLGQEADCFDILVVDNDSQDDTKRCVAEIAERFGRIVYFNTGANLGGAGGFHFGIKKALESGDAYVWLMDDDAVPEAPALTALREAADILGDRWAFLYSVVLWTDGIENRMNRPCIGRDCFETIGFIKDGILRIEQATFVSLFLRASTIYEVGLPIREFFLWGDDIEYTRRICKHPRMHGYLVGKSRVTHKTKSNMGSDCALDDPDRISQYRFVFRNEQYIYRKEGLLGVLRYSAKCALSLARIVIKADNHKAGRILAVCKGIGQGLFFHPKVEYAQRNDPAAAVSVSKIQKEQ